jgi:hypothetical protein
MAKVNLKLGYLEWLSLANLYQHRDQVSSPAKYVGLPNTIQALMSHQPPLAEWVGKSTQNQIHITAEGITLYETEMINS